MKLNPVDKKKILSTYLHPPTVRMLLAWIEELGVSYAQFERFYGFIEGTIKNIKYKGRAIPVKYWPVIYEKTPLSEIDKKFIKKYKEEKIVRCKKVAPKKEQPVVSTSILNKLRDIQNNNADTA